MEVLAEILNVCVKKGFNFRLDPTTRGVYVNHDSFKNELVGYYKGLMNEKGFTVEKILEEINLI